MAVVIAITYALIDPLPPYNSNLVLLMKGNFYLAFEIF